MKLKKIVDLGHELYNGMPNLGANIAAFWPQETHQHMRAVSGGKLVSESRMILVNEHIGTHVDAPYHFDEHGITVDQIPLTTLIQPGLLLDLRHKGHGEGITVEDLERAAEKAGRPIGPGWAVTLWTGVDSLWATEGFTAKRPYVPVTTAEWLIDQRIDLLCSDLIGLDITGVAVVPGSTDEEKRDAAAETWPMHTVMLKAGITLVQQLCNLDQLEGEPFLFVCLPMRMRGGTGSPVRPVALVFDEEATR